MRRVAAALRREPVRAYLYGLLAPGAALAVAYGLLEQNKAALWIAFGGIVLVPGAAELARANVTPVNDPRDNAGDQLWSFKQLPPRRTGRHAGGPMPPLYDFRSRPPGD